MNPGARRLLGWWLLALLVAAGFAQLGRWQLARMHEKETMLAAASSALERAGVDPQARGEVLTIDDFVAIAEQLPR